MESYPAPRSPLVNTPVCDSDEEVFFGPVTDKELLKASKLKRRTQLYFPALSWEPRVSPNIRDTPTAVEKADMADNVKLSLSADSLETSSFTTCDKLQDSSKGEFWSAHSENSSDLDSQSFENRAVMNFKCSDDSLEVDKPMPSRKITSQRAGGDCDGSSSGYFPISGSCSNISEDSLEDNAQLITGTGGREKNSQDNSVSTGLSSIAFSGSEISRHNQGMLADASCLALDSYFSNNSLQLLSASKKQQSDNWACNEENVSASTYNIIPDTDRNNTFTVEDETGLSASASKLCEPVQDLPKEDIADGDGGYLSILSEAAMYHAVQCNYKSSLQPLKLEESANTSQSLEDRFKNFGIDAAELEDQMLTSSILYETGRESNIITSEPESRTFYTGNNSSGKSSLDTFNPSRHTTQGHLGDVSSLSSLDFQWFPSQHITSGSQQSDCASLHQEGTLNRPIQSDTCNSSGSVCQNPREIEPCSQTTLTDSISKNLSYCSSSSGCSGEASAISGVCELNCVSKNQSSSSVQEEVVHSDSDASSLAEEMNDTLEEYEMMTRYGLDYILGHKGDRVKSNGKNNTGYSKEMEKESNCSKSPMNLNQNPNSSSLEYLDAVESSPSDNQEANCVTRNKTILSPPSKQILKTTPQQYLIASSGSSRNCHSKLPRFAPLTPVKTIESSAKTVLQTSSPQHAKHFARAVPLSSEIKLAFSKSSRQMMHTPEQKSSLFKKPVIPAIVPSRIPKSSGPSALTPRSMTKALEKIQSPVGAYIHNTPSPILVTNFKAKTCDRPAYEKEKHARALWRTGEVKSCIPRLGAALVSDVENVNPNINCGLPAVKYTKAPCVKLDENTKIPPPRVGEKISKLLDSPSPHVIKHEGRVRVNCGSPKLAAKMQSMADTFDDSLIDALSVSGDISVCVSQQGFDYVLKMSLSQNLSSQTFLDFINQN